MIRLYSIEFHVTLSTEIRSLKNNSTLNFIKGDDYSKLDIYLEQS